jgi:hypothetical protein
MERRTKLIGLEADCSGVSSEYRIVPLRDYIPMNSRLRRSALLATLVRLSTCFAFLGATLRLLPYSDSGFDLRINRLASDCGIFA